MKSCLLFLTCANSEEAQKIESALLEKRLVVCVKKTAVNSSFLFKGKIDHADEVMLVMDSVEEKFAAVEAEVQKLHSYDTFVLVSIPAIQTTTKVRNWIKEELN